VEFGCYKLNHKGSGSFDAEVYCWKFISLCCLVLAPHSSLPLLSLLPQVVTWCSSSSTLKIEVIRSCNTYNTTQCYSPEDHIPCKNLIFYTFTKLSMLHMDVLKEVMILLYFLFKVMYIKEFEKKKELTKHHKNYMFSNNIFFLFFWWQFISVERFTFISNKCLSCKIWIWKREAWSS
jgi:hypothetical protein